MTPHQIAAECRKRCAQRLAHALDIGGIRTREAHEIVLNVIRAEQRRQKPRLKLAA